MPMTLAHPMAVLPLRGLGMPTTALVVGSMVPDIPIFIDWRPGYNLSHSLLGVVSLDLVLASVIVLVWYVAVRDAVVDMAPQWVRARLRPRVRPTLRACLLTPVGAASGAATHVLWDSFTHVDRWGPDHFVWLRSEHHGLLGLKWMQYASGAVGLVVVTWVAVRYLRSLAPLPDHRGPAVLPALVLPAVVAASVLVGLVAVTRFTAYGFVTMAYVGVTRSLLALAILGALACLAWHVLARLGSTRRRGPARTP